MKEISHDHNENGAAQGKSVETEKKLAPSTSLRGAETHPGGSAMNRIKNSLVASGGLSLLIVLLGVAPAAAGPKNSQVALGTIESDNKFSWAVNVQFVSALACKGVLIAPRWVLTAAHCIDDRNHYTLEVFYERKDPVTGVMTSGSQETGLNSTFKHPDYREGFPDADIALVRLPKPFKHDPLLQPAELPTTGPALGRQGTVANFSHQKLLPAGQVAVLRAPILFVGETSTSRRTFNARSTTASLCPGDSGSGFMTLKGGLNVVTGIVSQAHLADCATANQEFEAVSVYHHLSWISSITGRLPRNITGAF
ncbi:MAG: S1 family peptidase, partial [Terriglobia bacterium]